MEPDDESTTSSTSTSSSATSQRPISQGQNSGLNGGLNGAVEDCQPQYFYFANNVATLSRRPTGPAPLPPQKKSNGDVYNAAMQRRPLVPDKIWNGFGSSASEPVRQRNGKAHLISPLNREAPLPAFNEVDGHGGLRYEVIRGSDYEGNPMEPSVMRGEGYDQVAIQHRRLQEVSKLVLIDYGKI